MENEGKVGQAEATEVTAETTSATVAELPRKKVKPAIPHPLDVTDLVQFFAAEKVTKGDETRMAKMIQRFKVTDQASLKSATKEYVERETKLGEKEKLIARVRASEIKTLYGYACNLGQSLDGIGYATAVTTARAALRAAKVKWDGSPVLEKEEREAKQRGKQVGAVAEQQYIAEQKERRAKGRDLTPEEKEQIRNVIVGKLARSEQVEFAAALVKKHGIAWCADLIECITAEILRVESEALEKHRSFWATGTEG